MKPFQPGSTYCKNLIVLMAILLLLPHISWAFDGGLLADHQPIIHDAGKSFFLPKQMGRITQCFQGRNKTIILIQDLHCHYEVQKKIAGIIQYFVKNHGLNLVGEEGANGTVDTSQMRSFPIGKIRQEVSGDFLRQGKLTGAEFYAATGERKIDLMGIETPALYDASEQIVRSFLNSESMGYCMDLREAMDSLKAYVYSPALSTFDQSRTDYRNGKLDVLGYAKQLKKQASHQGILIQSFPQLNRYLKNPSGHEVNVEALFKELDHLDQRLRQGLYGNEQQRTFDQTYRRLDIIEKLLNISADQKEVEDFRKNNDKYQVAGFIQFILGVGAQHVKSLQLERLSRLGNELIGLDHYLQQVKTFYDLADQRSRHFVVNLLNSMTEKKKSLAVMITGGFHTDTVFQELKSRGIGVIAIQPKMTKQDMVNPYFSLLQGKLLPIEELLAKNQTTLAIRSWPQTPYYASAVGITLGALAEALLNKLPPEKHRQLMAYITDHQKIVEMESMTPEGLKDFRIAPSEDGEVYLARTCEGKNLPVVIADKRLFSSKAKKYGRFKGIDDVGFMVFEEMGWKQVKQTLQAIKETKERQIEIWEGIHISPYVEKPFEIIRTPLTFLFEKHVYTRWYQYPLRVIGLGLMFSLMPLAVMAALQALAMILGHWEVVFQGLAATMGLAMVYYKPASFFEKLKSAYEQSAVRVHKKWNTLVPMAQLHIDRQTMHGLLDIDDAEDSWNYLLRYIISALNSPGNFASVDLGKVAMLLAQKDPSGDLLQELVVPVAQAWAQSGDLDKVYPLGHALGQLAQAMARTHQDASWFQATWLPLYQTVFKFDTVLAAESLGAVAQALAQHDSPDAWLDDLWLPLYEKALHDNFWQTQRAAARALGGLALAMAESKGSYKLGADGARKKLMALYDKCLASADDHVQEGAQDAMGDLAKALAMHDSSRVWYDNFWKSRLKEKSIPKRYIGDLAEAFVISDPSGQWLKQELMPALPREGAFVGLGGLARAIDKLEMSGQQLLDGAADKQALIEKIWMPYYEWLLTSAPQSAIGVMNFIESGDLDKVTEAALRLDPSGQFLAQVWGKLRTYSERQRENKRLIWTLQMRMPKLARILATVGDSDGKALFKTIWLPLYQSLHIAPCDSAVINSLMYFVPYQQLANNQSIMARAKTLHQKGIIPTPVLLQSGIKPAVIEKAWARVQRQFHRGYLFNNPRALLEKPLTRDLSYTLYHDQQKRDQRLKRVGYDHFEQYTAKVRADPRGQAELAQHYEITRIKALLQEEASDQADLDDKLTHLFMAGGRDAVGDIEDLFDSKPDRSDFPTEAFSPKEVLRAPFYSGLLDLLSTKVHPGFLYASLKQLKAAYGESFWTYWPEFVELGVSAGGAVDQFFSDGLCTLKPYVTSAEDLRRLSMHMLPHYNLASGVMVRNNGYFHYLKEHLSDGVIKEHLTELLDLDEQARRTLLSNLDTLSRQGNSRNEQDNLLQVFGVEVLSARPYDDIDEAALFLSLGEDGILFIQNISRRRRLDTRSLGQAVIAVPGRQATNEEKRKAVRREGFRFFLDVLTQMASESDQQWFGDQDWSMQQALGIVPLGVPVDAARFGNKAASFAGFADYRYPYPGGVVLSRSVAEKIADLSEKVKIQAGDDFVVRSSPQYSMPGQLLTVAGIANNPDSVAAAIKQVLASWDKPSARKYRADHDIPQDSGMGVIIETYAPTDKNEQSGYGVAFTSHPDTGEPGLCGNFAVKAKGEDLVSGRVAGRPITALKSLFPEAYQYLAEVATVMERTKRFPQELEFGIVDGKLQLFSSRAILFSQEGELNFYRQALAQGLISDGEYTLALDRLQNRRAARMMYKLASKEGLSPAGRGLAATSGAMAGKVAFDIKKASAWVKAGPVILVANQENREDIIRHITDFPRVGLITLYGSASSHEAVVTRAAGIPSLINLVNARLDLKAHVLHCGRMEIHEGDQLILDGHDNHLFTGRSNGNHLVEDKATMDASYNIDIPAYLDEIKQPYLNANGQINASITLEDLVELNQRADLEFINYKRSGNEAEALKANLRKHVFHVLLLEKARVLGQNEDKIKAGLEEALEQSREEYVKNLPLDADLKLGDLKQLTYRYVGHKNVIALFKLIQESVDSIVRDPRQGVKLAEAIRSLRLEPGTHPKRENIVYLHFAHELLRNVYLQLLLRKDFKDQKSLKAIGRTLGRSENLVDEDIRVFADTTIPDWGKKERLLINEGVRLVKIGGLPDEDDLQRLAMKLADYPSIRIFNNLYVTGDNHRGFVFHYDPELLVPQADLNAARGIIERDGFEIRFEKEGIAGANYPIPDGFRADLNLSIPPVSTGQGASRLWYTIHNYFHTPLSWEDYQNKAHALENRYLWKIIIYMIAMFGVGTLIWGVSSGDYSMLMNAGKELTGFKFGWIKSIGLVSWLAFFVGSHGNPNWLKGYVGRMFNQGAPVENNTPRENLRAAWRIFLGIAFAHLGPLVLAVPLAYRIHEMINWKNRHHDFEVARDLKLSSVKPGFNTSLRAGLRKNTMSKNLLNLARTAWLMIVNKAFVTAESLENHPQLNALIDREMVNYFRHGAAAFASLPGRKTQQYTVHYETINLFGFVIKLFLGRYQPHGRPAIYLPQSVAGLYVNTTNQHTIMGRFIHYHTGQWLAWVILKSAQQRFAPTLFDRGLETLYAWLGQPQPRWRRIVRSFQLSDDLNRVQAADKALKTVFNNPRGEKKPPSQLLFDIYQCLLLDSNVEQLDEPAVAARLGLISKLSSWQLPKRKVRLKNGPTLVIPMPMGQPKQQLIIQQLYQLEIIDDSEPKRSRPLHWLQRLRSSA